MKFVKKLVKKSYIDLTIPFLAFSLLYLPFLNVIPYRDGAIEFIQSYDVYHGGLTEYLQNWGSVHPPLKFFLLTLLYHLLGMSTFSYTLLGFLLGITTLFVFYKITDFFFLRETAYTATLFLAISPLFLATGIFSMLDFLVTCFILISFLFYIKKKYFLYAISAGCLVLCKETGLLLPLVITSVELFIFLKTFFKNEKLQGKTFFVSLFPFLTFGLWYLFLQLHQQKPWQDYVFSSVANKGTFYVVLYNLFTGQFINKYSMQNWQQVFFLNFNWVYWFILLCWLIYFCFHEKKKIMQTILRLNKYFVVCILFFLSYLTTVLALQTYTIPRYELPLYPFLYMSLAVIVVWVEKKQKRLEPFFFLFVTVIMLLSLFSSIDPLSQALWGIAKVNNQTLYGVNHYLAGNDGITYNLQYLFILKNRTQELENIEAGKALVSDYSCDFLFHDPNNDKQVMYILKLNYITMPACSDYSD